MKQAGLTLAILKRPPFCLRWLTSATKIFPYRPKLKKLQLTLLFPNIFRFCDSFKMTVIWGLQKNSKFKKSNHFFYWTAIILTSFQSCFKTSGRYLKKITEEVKVQNFLFWSYDGNSKWFEIETVVSTHFQLFLKFSEKKLKSKLFNFVYCWS